MPRTDIHRKSELIPTDYEHVLSYNLATQEDGWPIPSFGVSCHRGKHTENGLCCIVGMKSNPNIKWAKHGSTGQCTACGTRFIYGEVWKHIPTGEHIHIGHICGRNYGLDFDRSEFDNKAEKAKRATMQELVQERNRQEKEEFLAEYPGLKEAFETDHYIIQDIKARFEQYRTITEKQVELVFKLHKQATIPQKEEKKTTAPTGKQTFKGKIVSEKVHEGYYGTTIKITVKVETPNGIWLAWGTKPKGLGREDHKGKTVELTATLSRSSDDSSFAFFKRPKGKIVELAE